MITHRVKGKNLCAENESTLWRQQKVAVRQGRAEKDYRTVGRCELGNCGNGVSVDADYAITMTCDVITSLLSDMQWVYGLSLQRRHLAQTPHTRG